MKKKFLGASCLLSLAVLTLASCGQSTKNSSTPTGNLDLTKVVATAGENGKYTLKNDLYYNKLRYNGNSLVTNKIKEVLYAKELKAVKELFYSTSVNDLSEETKNLIVPSKDEKQNSKLFSLDGLELLNNSYINENCTNNYDVLKFNLQTSINGSLSTAVFSTQDSDSIKNKENNNTKEFNKSINTFIVSNARKGITVTEADLKCTYPNDESDFKVVKFNNIYNKDSVLTTLINTYFLDEAEKLSAQNALDKVAYKEYIKAYNASETDEETKNSFYLFKEDTIEDTYETSYQTFGTYHAVLIQFNSRKEAYDVVNNLTDDNGNKINFSNITTIDEASTAYKALYNKYYEYKKVDSLDDTRFYYVNNLNKNDFNDLSEGVTTLIKTTLEDNQWLTEPRNVNNKYVMALRLDTVYDVSNDNEEATYSDLTDEEKATYEVKIKYNTLITSASGYTSNNFKSMVYNRSNNDNKEDDIFIYDPLFEYKFYNSYSTDYVCIDKAKFNKDLILQIDDIKYTVEDFYNEASKEYSNSIITNYFELEYAYTYYDEYVDSDTHKTNVETLETAINDFNAGKNTSYDKEIGLETFLLNSYGFTNKDDVVKYYYDAQTCLSSYTSKKIFENWAKKNEDGTYTYADNLNTEGILYNLLSEGNKKYSDLFSINLDHFLINIDDDGDGSPDDPAKLMDKMNDQEKADFKNAVVELARALYTEATNPAYENNSLYKILTFIKTQYEEGATLKSDTTKTWDDFKKYNFLITVEQLASSGDITQSTVSNFVTPFADYVKGVFKACLNNSNISTSYSNGKFVYYNTSTKEGNLISSADDITVDTLCETVYGYHVLVLNSYSKAKETKYTADDDSSKVQSNIQLLIKEDEDDSKNNIYITINSYNEEKTTVSFNQFFIYYIQKANGVESSLSSNISTLLSSMFDEVINTYTSNNFQTLLLLDLLDIQTDNEKLAEIINAERDFYANVICDYADNADPNNDGNIYYAWVFGDMNWTRPEK